MLACIPWGKKAKAKAKADFLNRALERPLLEGGNTCVVCSQELYPTWNPPCSTHKACQTCWVKYVVTAESDVCGICVHVAERGRGGDGS